MKPCAICRQAQHEPHRSITDCLAAALAVNDSLRAAVADKDALIRNLALGRPASRTTSPGESIHV